MSNFSLQDKTWNVFTLCKQTKNNIWKMTNINPEYCHKTHRFMNI